MKVCVVIIFMHHHVDVQISMLNAHRFAIITVFNSNNWIKIDQKYSKNV